MERKFQLAVCLLIVCKVLHINCEYFSVVGSKTLRIDEPYKVAITNHESNTTCVITVGIEGTSFDGDNYDIAEVVSVEPGETATIKLEV